MPAKWWYKQHSREVETFCQACGSLKRIATSLISMLYGTKGRNEKGSAARVGDRIYFEVFERAILRSGRSAILL
jgi:hypothetical protein